MEPHHDKTQNRDCERSQPVSRPAGYGRDVDRGDRDEPIELACRWHCSWCRAPAAEETRDRRARIAEAVDRWRAEAEKKGHRITRIAVAFEAGHDGFWLARWLAAQGIEAHVIHASSVAVTREHRRAKTDRLDTELLKRGFLGWLRGERGHCKMVAVPTLAEEDAKRPSRERETLWLARRAVSSRGSRRRSCGSAFAASIRSSRRPPRPWRTYARRG